MFEPRRHSPEIYKLFAMCWSVHIFSVVSIFIDFLVEAETVPISWNN